MYFECDFQLFRHNLPHIRGGERVSLSVAVALTICTALQSEIPKAKIP